MKNNNLVNAKYSLSEKLATAEHNAFFNYDIWKLPFIDVIPFKQHNKILVDENLIFGFLTPDELSAYSTLALALIGLVTAGILIRQLKILLEQTKLIINQTNVLIEQNTAFKESVNISTHQFRVTHRSWIKCKVELTSLKFDFPIENRVEAIVKFTLINTGNLPATNTFFDFRLCIGREPSEYYISLQNQLKAQLKLISKGLESGNTIFPNDQISIHLTHYADLPVSNLPLIDTNCLPDLYNICIVGCVDYRSSSGIDHHLTSFAYDMHRLNFDVPSINNLNSDENSLNSAILKIVKPVEQPHSDLIPRMKISSEKICLLSKSYVQGNLFVTT